MSKPAFDPLRLSLCLLQASNQVYMLVKLGSKDRTLGPAYVNELFGQQFMWNAAQSGFAFSVTWPKCICDYLTCIDPGNRVKEKQFRMF